MQWRFWASLALLAALFKVKAQFNQDDFVFDDVLKTFYQMSGRYHPEYVQQQHQQLQQYVQEQQQHHHQQTHDQHPQQHANHLNGFEEHGNYHHHNVEELTKPVEVPYHVLKDNIYDFIVVGSGSSGSVIARRLSENPHWNVLLLEKGKGENLLTRIPFIAHLFQSTKYNWGYLMEHQPNFALGFEDHMINWPAGKALGGTSVINFNIYSRGNPEDYHLWAKSGNPGWSYPDVLPYFLKNEKGRLHEANYDYHSHDGVISVEEGYETKLTHAFIQAGGELGYHKFIDYNTPHQFGFSTTQGTLLRGQRHSTARGYLFPILHSHHNLHVLTEAFATKILIHPITKIAYGVEYYKNGEKHVAYVKKEIIVSAGTFNSPKLLMLSGIGPQHHLTSHGIPVIKDLPVGEHLHDHVTYLGTVFTSKKPLPTTILDLLNPFTLKRYLAKHDGPLVSLGGIDAVGLVHTNVSRSVDRPDVELMLIDASFATDFGLFFRPIYRLQKDVYEHYFAPLQKQYTFSIFPVLLHPKSSGKVRLRSKDPHDPPLLYGNYFTDPKGHDMATMIAALRMVVKLGETDTFHRYGLKMYEEAVPGCGWYEHNSDAYWECAIRTLGYSFFDQIGTNRMGPPGDPHSVVNHELKVYGIQGLRVADASIIPVTLGAHTHAPCMMIGEKAAEMIAHAWESEADDNK